MIFLSLVLVITTALLCYAGYIFLIVDRRQESSMLSDADLFHAIDDKNYDFELPEEIDEYEELRESQPGDKRALPMALLKRAMADIPRIEQLERDHPRMARLFQKGLLPFGIWEQLVDAEAMMDTEVHSVQSEAEKLQKGWGQGIFSQAYQMLRQKREEEVRSQQMQRDAAVLTMEFTKPSGGVVKVQADGRKVTQQTPLGIRKESADMEVTFKSEVNCELVTGSGDEQRQFCCKISELVLDPEQEKQWKQLGQDASGLRLQVKFVRRTHGVKAGFAIADIRATIPSAPTVIAAPTSPTKAAAA
ncbi:hypothetical protein AB1Y20_016604 [Prymnesium parvum]|uniref:Uncharacterized protein n=1 Tax=Prymnesium parvum TaxID=97485 RepID=A0AB34ID77_PRYPA|mmetsp:Transcript_950/g.2470  ORF Transcript_950/g.2470 Transcript_950/m.2470 type:complete len:304 (-) Transcript_950:254-1165(-)